MESKLLVKGMVCQRCITTIHDQLTSLGIRPKHISLGEVLLSPGENVVDKPKIEEALQRHGFSLLENRSEKITREVKQLVSEVYSGDFDFPYLFRFSDLISKHLNKDYDTISSIFSSYEHVTLEKYIIDYRIGKVKEFLVYSSFSLEDIAFKLGFSSAPHLSRQFKSITGMNPSTFRHIQLEKKQVANAG